MPRMTATGQGVLVGEQLDSRQLEALKRASIQGSDVLDNFEALNEEIQETYQTAESKKVGKLPQSPVGRPTPKSLKQQSRVEAKAEEIRQSMGEPELDLDGELDSLLGKPPVETQQGGADIKSEVLGLLQRTPGAPDQAQIERWKAQLGQGAVYCLALGEGDVYVFTHLKRGQWQKIQEVMAKIGQTGTAEGAALEEQMKEKVIQYCVLWPKPLPVEFFYNSRAGVVDRLYETILMNSYFLRPEQTLYLTVSL